VVCEASQRSDRFAHRPDLVYQDLEVSGLSGLSQSWQRGRSPELIEHRQFARHQRLSCFVGRRPYSSMRAAICSIVSVSHTLSGS
jgi:hypothetical protein